MAENTTQYENYIRSFFFRYLIVFHLMPRTKKFLDEIFQFVGQPSLHVNIEKEKKYVKLKAVQLSFYKLHLEILTMFNLTSSEGENMIPSMEDSESFIRQKNIKIPDYDEQSQDGWQLFYFTFSSQLSVPENIENFNAFVPAEYISEENMRRENNLLKERIIKIDRERNPPMSDQ